MHRPTYLKKPLLTVCIAITLNWFYGATGLPSHELNNSNFLLSNPALAMSYSGFRDGQHPGNGEEAVYPSEAELLEDLTILSDVCGTQLIRLYSVGGNTESILKLIQSHSIALKVMLGAWLDAEIDNHANCPWMNNPLSDSTLQNNRILNETEISETIRLANEFPEVVVSVNIGNEALADWSDHLVSTERMLYFVNEVKSQIQQPITIADGYDYWLENAPSNLVESLDFLAIHIYPQWKGYAIEEGLSFVDTTISEIQTRYPGKPLVITETGWATVAVEFGERANEIQQKRYFEEIGLWSSANHRTVFWFEAFDENWKGNPNLPDGAEKHWGLFDANRNPKLAIRALRR